MSSEVSNWVLSLASPPGGWNSRELPLTAAETWACGRAVEELDPKCAVWLHPYSNWKNASSSPQTSEMP